jgi:hypothetical protein
LPCRIHRPALPVDVKERQADQLAPSYTGRVQGLEDRPVAKASRLIEVRDSHHLLDLGDRQHVFREPVLEAWELQLGGGVVEQVVLPREPAEEGPHRDEPGVLGAEGERLTVRLPPVVERALVALQDGLGDLFRGSEPALEAPGDEVPQARLTVLNRGESVVVHLEPLEIAHHEGRKPLAIAPIGERPLGARPRDGHGSASGRRSG